MRLLWLCIALFLAAAPLRAEPPAFHHGVSVHLIVDDTQLNVIKTEQEAQHVAAAGFDFVRLTVDPYLYLYHPSQEKTDRLNASVLGAVNVYEAQGMKVLIDFHAIPKGAREFGSEEFTGNKTLFDAYTAAAANLASVLSKDRFEGRAFEPFNEPVLDCDHLAMGQWPDMALQLHHEIRTQAPKLTLVMEGGCWATAQGLMALDPIAFADSNIIWSFHDYAPMIFTHQGASWVEGASRYAAFVPYPARASDLGLAQKLSRDKISAAKLDAEILAKRLSQQDDALKYYFAKQNAKMESAQSFKKIALWAQHNRLPHDQILLGEFGAIRASGAGQPNLASRIAYLREKRQFAEEHGWAWAIWDWDGSFGLTSGQGIDPTLAKALGLKIKKPLNVR